MVEKKDGLLKFYIQFAGLFQGTDIVILRGGGVVVKSSGQTNGQQSITVYWEACRNKFTCDSKEIYFRLAVCYLKK